MNDVTKEIAKEIEMFVKRLLCLLIACMQVLTACATQVETIPLPTSALAATQSKEESITLHLAVADAQGRPSEPYVLEFIEQVKVLSDGLITIMPTWDAGADITPFFEQGVVKIVKEGRYELGLAGSRAWDSSGVTSFQALQAPFLITNDALAEAVASSEIGIQILDRLSSVGITGLALWPEDLRHPFSMTPDQPILSPNDLKGLTVRSIPSEVSYLLIDTLGGSPMYGDDYQAAESGLRQGASLNGTPTATGNVIFFPKFQVLFANGAALEKLSEAQRSILREAAEATQKKAIAEHPSEADAAAAWCADGGTVVMASDEQIAAFEAAAQPVFDKIGQDPLNAELIAAIRELKAKTTPSAGAVACAPTLDNVSPEPNEESEVWSPGLPPNGVWQVELITNDIVQKGVMESEAVTWAGTYTWTFEDSKAQIDYTGTAGTDFSCEADLIVEEDVVKVIYSSGSACDGEVDDIQWRLDADGLHLQLLAITNAPLVENKAYYEAKPWQKIAE